MNRDIILSVQDLHIDVHGIPDAKILRGVSFDVCRGETLAIVGESGCGKSITSLAIMGLLPEALQKTGGRLIFEGSELPVANNEAMRKIRGKRIGMVFQEPMSALNPVHTIGNQVAEVILEHERVPRAVAHSRAVELLGHMGLPDPAALAHEYPHLLSGGQRQRVVIAMALACNPDLLIADEPTTALDVTVQAQIMALLDRLKRELNIALILITHNLGLVAQTADRVAVMYAGACVEQAPVQALFSNPAHPYTVGLLRATPRPGRRPDGGKQMSEIAGTVPSIIDPMPGCRFQPRCANAIDECLRTVPSLRQYGRGFVACYNAMSSE
jgi:peptide/nickel transport system ATP-binding protein